MNETAHLKVIKSREQALEAIQAATAENITILDFDKTLFLRNSTEEYLSFIRPQVLGAAYLQFAKVACPWRWLSAPPCSKEISKGWFLVVSAILLFPWTILVWQ